MHKRLCSRRAEDSLLTSPMGRLEYPHLDLVLDFLGPASSVQVRLLSTQALTAWSRALVRWMRWQLGPEGWLATDLDQWWKRAPTTKLLRSGRQSGELRRLLGEEAERRLLVAVEADPRAALRRLLQPAPAAASVPLAAPGREELSLRSAEPLVDQYRSLLRGLEWPQLWRKLWQVLCWMPEI